MAAVGKSMDLGLRVDPPPLVEEMAVEDEVALAPADQHRPVAEHVQAGRRVAHDAVSPVARSERDVLDEAQGGNAVGPAVVGRAVGVADRSRQGLAGARRPRRAARETVQASHHQRPQRRVADQPQLPREGLRPRQVKGGRVEDHQPPDPLGVVHRPGEPDHAAPIVHDEVEALEPELVHEPGEVGDPPLERVGVAIVAGLVGGAAADVVGDHHAVVRAQRPHQVAVVEGPRGVAVDRHHRLAMAFVEIVVPQAVEVQDLAREGVQLLRDLPHGASAPVTTAGRPSCS